MAIKVAIPPRADSNFSVTLSLANSKIGFRLSFGVKSRKNLIRMETILISGSMEMHYRGRGGKQPPRSAEFFISYESRILF